LVTAYRWVFYPDAEGLNAVRLETATKDERIVTRAVARLSSSDYGPQKVFSRISATYFDAKIGHLPSVWPDHDKELNLQDLARRFSRLSYLPVLPEREDALTACVVEGVKAGTWAVVLGDPDASTYHRIIEDAAGVEGLSTLLDGSASLVRGELRELIRKQLGGEVMTPPPPPPPPGNGGPKGTPGQPEPAKRYKYVRLSIKDLSVTKAHNLQPYVFKLLQEVDVGTSVSLAIDVDCPAGVPEEVLKQKIEQSLEMLQIKVDWEPAG
jgi:hypothetical protein